MFKQARLVSYHGIQWYQTNYNFTMSAIRSSVGSAYNDCKIHFYTSKNKAHATEKMIITGDGKVGIGNE